jgi:FMN reductase
VNRATSVADLAPARSGGIARDGRDRLVVVGIGGTTRADSSSERLLRRALESVTAAGGEAVMLAATDLDLPMYAPELPGRTERAQRLVREVARADGVIISSPGYHGGISGLIKNALDYIEDLRDDERPYLDGRAVGCLACARGWQATATTLGSLRSTVHALRGWPTPLGVRVNTAEPTFGSDGTILDEDVGNRLDLLGRQVVGFAQGAGR